MSGNCVGKLPHSCGTRSGLQCFEQEDGSVTGYCFSCKMYVPDPYGDLPKGHLPQKLQKKTPEEIKEEMDFISTLQAVDLPERKLRKSVLEYYGIRIGLSEEDGKTVAFHHYPYYKDGELKRYKTRLVEPRRMWSVGFDNDVDLFGWEQAKAKGVKRVIITEGECFLPEAQVLTRDGWVALKDWDGQEVLQVNEDQSSQFVSPLALVDKEFDGELVEYKSGSYYSLTTPNHNLVRIDKEGGLFKAKASDLKKKHYNVPRVTHLNEDEWFDDTLLRIRVMVSADFTLREYGDVYGQFKKTRKVERAKNLLDKAGVRYSCNPVKGGYFSVFIHRGHGLDLSKELSYKDINTAQKCRTLIEELVHWDGNMVPNRKQVEYSSKLLHNAEVVQSAAHLCGYTSTIIRRSNELGSWYKVSILLGKTSSSTQKGAKFLPYKGRVMCLTVPSGMLLVRQKESISVSGNCDAAALHRILEMYSKPEYKDSQPAVCSLPNGAASAARDLGKLLPKIRKHFKEISLCFDGDEAGKKATEAVCKICPEATVITLPLKDANQCLIEGKGKAAYNATIFNHQKNKNTRLIWGGEVHEAAKKIPEWGFSWPWQKVNDVTRGIRLGETIYFGAGVKMGKSELLNALASHFMKEHGWKVFMAKPEEANAKTYKLLAGKLTGKVFHDPKVEFDEEAFERAGEVLKDSLCMVNLYQHIGWETLKDDIRAAALEGCKAIFIDPVTNLVNGMEAAAANVVLQEIAQELAAMAKDLDVVILIFCHLKAPTTGDSHERGGEVLSSQFAGSRAMMRSCNYMFGLEGNKDPDLPPYERNMRTLVLLEDREYGEVGRYPLYWDSRTQLFNEA